MQLAPSRARLSYVINAAIVQRELIATVRPISIPTASRRTRRRQFMGAKLRCDLMSAMGRKQTLGTTQRSPATEQLCGAVEGV
jgi:hypothetical protein